MKILDRAWVVGAAAMMVLSSGSNAAAAEPKLRLPSAERLPAVERSSATTRAVVAAKCAKPTGLPTLRRSGALVVESPPRPRVERWLRLRTHQSQHHRSIGARLWEGPEVPIFVPLTISNMELEVLDPVAGGYLALYRSAPASGSANGRFEARLFSCAGNLRAALPLNPLLSRSHHLEVQDIRYAGGKLYFNEACQTYSREAGGRCSALVAADPFTKKVLWRTPSLTSNGVLRVVGKHIVAGYGFTGERAFLRVVRRSDGRVVVKKPMPANHFGLETRGRRLDVEIGGKWLSYRMTSFDTDNPSLKFREVRARAPKREHPSRVKLPAKSTSRQTSPRRGPTKPPSKRRRWPNKFDSGFDGALNRR